MSKKKQQTGKGLAAILSDSAAAANIRITKVKITKDDTLELEYEETRGKEKFIFAVAGKAIVHGDIKEAFRSLAPHMALICDLKEEKHVNQADIGRTDLSKLSTIIMTGISIGGNGESEGLTLVGKRLISVKVLNLVSPFTKWEDEEYEFCSELGEAVEVILHEAKEYLAGRKFGQKQEEIGFEEASDDAPAPAAGGLKVAAG